MGRSILASSSAEPSDMTGEVGIREKYSWQAGRLKSGMNVVVSKIVVAPKGERGLLNGKADG